MYKAHPVDQMVTKLAKRTEQNSAKMQLKKIKKAKGKTRIKNAICSVANALRQCQEAPVQVTSKPYDYSYQLRFQPFRQHFVLRPVNLLGGFVHLLYACTNACVCVV
jgi:hypothetical protein